MHAVNELQGLPILDEWCQKVKTQRFVLHCKICPDDLYPSHSWRIYWRNVLNFPGSFTTQAFTTRGIFFWQVLQRAHSWLHEFVPLTLFFSPDRLGTSVFAVVLYHHAQFEHPHFQQFYWAWASFIRSKKCTVIKDYINVFLVCMHYEFTYHAYIDISNVKHEWVYINYKKVSNSKIKKSQVISQQIPNSEYNIEMPLWMLNVTN